MLSYLEYVNESKHKLVRVKAGVYKILDLRLNETGMYLDQNLKYGKKWDLMVDEESKGEFKTKLDALSFIEAQ